MADALWSINERLGGKPGLDLDRLGGGWIHDVIKIEERRGDRRNAEAANQFMEDLGL